MNSVCSRNTEKIFLTLRGKMSAIPGVPPICVADACDMIRKKVPALDVPGHIFSAVWAAAENALADAMPSNNGPGKISPEQIPLVFWAGAAALDRVQSIFGAIDKHLDLYKVEAELQAQVSDVGDTSLEGNWVRHGHAVMCLARSCRAYADEMLSGLDSKYIADIASAGQDPLAASQATGSYVSYSLGILLWDIWFHVELAQAMFGLVKMAILRINAYMPPSPTGAAPPGGWPEATGRKGLVSSAEAGMALPEVRGRVPVSPVSPGANPPLPFFFDHARALKNLAIHDFSSVGGAYLAMEELESRLIENYPHDEYAGRSMNVQWTEFLNSLSNAAESYREACRRVPYPPKWKTSL